MAAPPWNAAERPTRPAAMACGDLSPNEIKPQILSSVPAKLPPKRIGRSRLVRRSVTTCVAGLNLATSLCTSIADPKFTFSAVRSTISPVRNRDASLQSTVDRTVSIGILGRAIL